MNTPESVILKLQRDVYPMKQELSKLEDVVHNKIQELKEAISDFNYAQKNLVEICSFVGSEVEGMKSTEYVEEVMGQRLAYDNILEETIKELKI